MPARIVVVHDDPVFGEATLAALCDAGHDVVAFQDTMSALDAREVAQPIELLITRLQFPAGQPNRVSLGTDGAEEAPWGQGLASVEAGV